MASEPSRSSPFWGPDATSFQWQIEEKWGEGVGRWRRKLFTYYIINTWIYDHQQSSKTLWVLHQDRTSRKRSRDGETYDRLPSCSFFCSSWSASFTPLLMTGRLSSCSQPSFSLLPASSQPDPGTAARWDPVQFSTLYPLFSFESTPSTEQNSCSLSRKKSNITRTYLHLPKSVGSHFNCQFSLHIYPWSFESSAKKKQFYLGQLTQMWVGRAGWTQTFINHCFYCIFDPFFATNKINSR